MVFYSNITSTLLKNTELTQPMANFGLSLINYRLRNDVTEDGANTTVDTLSQFVARTVLAVCQKIRPSRSSWSETLLKQPLFVISRKPQSIQVKFLLNLSSLEIVHIPFMIYSYVNSNSGFVSLQRIFYQNCTLNCITAYHAPFTQRSCVTDRRKPAEFVRRHSVHSHEMLPVNSNKQESE